MRHYNHDSSRPTHFSHSIGASRSVHGIPATDSPSPSSGTGPIADDSLKEHLKNAAEIVAAAIKEAALPTSRRVAASVHVEEDDGNIQVVSGGPDAPQAVPFDPPEGQRPSRHPLFGDKRRWYDQPVRPFTEEGVEASADAAAEEVAGWLDDLGNDIGSDHP